MKAIVRVVESAGVISRGLLDGFYRRRADWTVDSSEGVRVLTRLLSEQPSDALYAVVSMLSPGGVVKQLLPLLAARAVLDVDGTEATLAVGVAPRATLESGLALAVEEASVGNPELQKRASEVLRYHGVRQSVGAVVGASGVESSVPLGPVDGSSAVESVVASALDRMSVVVGLREEALSDLDGVVSFLRQVLNEEPSVAYSALKVLGPSVTIPLMEDLVDASLSDRWLGGVSVLMGRIGYDARERFLLPVLMDQVAANMNDWRVFGGAQFLAQGHREFRAELREVALRSSDPDVRDLAIEGLFDGTLAPVYG
ncbi:MAG: hypothetical protein QM713_06230 [Arachnia sp.]